MIVYAIQYAVFELTCIIRMLAISLMYHCTSSFVILVYHVVLYHTIRYSMMVYCILDHSYIKSYDTKCYQVSWHIIIHVDGTWLHYAVNYIAFCTTCAVLTRYLTSHFSWLRCFTIRHNVFRLCLSY